MIRIPFLLLILIAFSFLFSCKKGEEDPFLSFKSRESRLCGEWKMTSYFWRSEYNTNYAEFSGNENVMIKSSCVQFQTSSEYTYSVNEYRLSILTDGTWTWIKDFDYTGYKSDQWAQSTTHTTGSIRETLSGVWSFKDETTNEFKDGERVDFYVLNEIIENGTTYKNNDTIAPSTTETTHVYGTYILTFELLKLAKKEMKWTAPIVVGYGTSPYKEQITWTAQ